MSGGSGADGGATGATGGSGAGGGSGSGGSGTTGEAWQTGGSDGEGDGGKHGKSNGSGSRNGKGDSAGTGSGKGDGKGGGNPPGWLPWGPKSPNTDITPEPDSVYDDLQRGECRKPYEIATDPAQQTGNRASPEAWRVIEGLAGICKAARGERDGLSIATKAEARLRASGYRPSGVSELCKDEDAFGVLRRFVAYYRQHPGERVVLRPAPSATRACENRLSVSEDSVGPGGTIHLSGTWPDWPSSVELRADELAKPIVLKPFGDADDGAKCCKDALLIVDLPGADGFEGRRPTSVDVTLVTRDGTRLVKNAAVVIDWSGVGSPPNPSGPSPSVSARMSSPGSPPAPPDATP
ncbi:hypothetical protein CP975_31430 [Streptomyces alboniger]|uniref:Uncharacterized protein n=1 Tax=Streptomyces alboniger TaxID=132473 RepID=A0A5J6HSQ5_STRAD|nr:hypothetical protein CP975_31430 [Streptomyces alboniger]